MAQKCNNITSAKTTIGPYKHVKRLNGLHLKLSWIALWKLQFHINGLRPFPLFLSFPHLNHMRSLASFGGWSLSLELKTELEWERA